MGDQAREVVQSQFAGQDLNFRFITLREPLKENMVPFLEREHSHEQGSSASLASLRPRRLARVQVVAKTQESRNQLHELLVDVDTGEVVSNLHLEGKHPYIDAEYMKEVEVSCLADDGVQQEIKKLDIPACGTVVVEPWAYATDGENDVSQRTTMVR